MISEPIVKTEETSRELSKVFKNCFDDDGDDNYDDDDDNNFDDYIYDDDDDDVFSFLCIFSY